MIHNFFSFVNFFLFEKGFPVHQKVLRYFFLMSFEITKVYVINFISGRV